MVGNKLVKIMQDAGKPSSSESTDLLFGEVTSVSPLKIKIDNRFEVGEEFLILSALVRDTVINIPAIDVSYREDNQHSHVIPATVTLSIDSNNNPVNHNHKIASWNTELALPSIRLWRGLIVGDKVRVLRVNQGQMFYVLEREEGVNDTRTGD
jgi:hypothetical protein